MPVGREENLSEGINLTPGRSRIQQTQVFQGMSLLEERVLHQTYDCFCSADESRDEQLAATLM